jgi:hypothetical protein
VHRVYRSTTTLKKKILIPNPQVKVTYSLHPWTRISCSKFLTQFLAIIHLDRCMFGRYKFHTQFLTQNNLNRLLRSDNAYLLQQSVITTSNPFPSIHLYIFLNWCIKIYKCISFLWMKFNSVTIHLAHYNGYFF